MFLFDIFRSFLPLHNPIGFGAVDFAEFAIAATLVALILLWDRIVAALQTLSAKPRLSIAILAGLPIALRLVLLPRYPIPTPSGSDDFSYLLLGDTLRHFRFSNPVHPMHRFFESIFVLQEPSYSSIFPLGQGIILILGWTGVLLTGGAFCALVYWMLRAWTKPLWALLGGFLAVAEFGPLCVWMNDYWGGYLSACAGCLIFGALPRKGTRYNVLLGVGIAIQWITRPFECVLLLIPVGFILWRERIFPRAAFVPMAFALVLTAGHNYAVTKSWTTMPYMASRYQYGVPASFTTQPNPAPHRELTPEQQLDYEAQSAVHDSGSYWQRFTLRLSFYRFFLLVPLFLAPLALLRERRFAVVAGTILVLALGTAFYPYFYPHYIAAATCLFVWIAVAGLASMNRELARSVFLLCGVHAILWYGLHLAAPLDQRVTLIRFENWDFINFGDPDGRIAVNRQLAGLPESQLVFVRYGAHHGFHEWIHNEADIDHSKVIWAVDRGEEENRKLMEYYPKRTVLIVEPDANPPRLSLYR